MIRVCSDAIDAVLFTRVFKNKCYISLRLNKNLKSYVKITNSTTILLQLWFIDEMQT